MRSRLGVGLQRAPGTNAVFHWGRNPAVRGALVFYPDAGAGVVVLANGGTAGDAVAEAALRAIVAPRIGPTSEVWYASATSESPPSPRRRPMASRKRYRLDQVAVEPGAVRRAKWTFAKGGRQAPVKGSELLYTVTDGNLAGRNKWEFLVRVPDAPDGRVEIRPRTTPPIHTWKALTYRSLQFQKATKGEARGKRYCKVSLAVPPSGRAKDDPRGTRTKDVIRGDQRHDLPKWFESLQGRMRTKERVRSTKGTDGNTLVILVQPDDHAMMIRLYFAMKVWILKEGIELE